MTMAMAEAIARAREAHVGWCAARNITARAEDIAEKLMEMEDQAKLRKIHRWIGNHLKNPKRSLTERHVDLGRLGIGTPRGNKGAKRAAAEAAEILRLRAEQEAQMIEEDRRIAVVKDALKAGLITQKQFDAYWCDGTWCDIELPPPAWLIELRNRLKLSVLATPASSI